ncbi:MAG TPA: hypothetical protein VMG99_09010 [Thermoplasmata archaeon]|nr:hypothetical protein [Thermoplasmata archaeon]
MSGWNANQEIELIRAKDRIRTLERVLSEVLGSGSCDPDVRKRAEAVLEGKAGGT